MNTIQIKRNMINLDLDDQLTKICNNMLLFSDNILNELGHDHSECIYHRSFEIELRKNGINYSTEVIIPINYHGHTVGSVRPDLIVEDKYIIELKSIPSLKRKEINQLKLYLRHTRYNYGFLINFPNTTNDDNVCEIILIKK